MHPKSPEPYPSSGMHACPQCGLFLSNTPKSQVVLTDGACSDNGQHNAAAGCGVAMGEKQSHHLALPFGGMEPTKTNQRAELLAAYAGIVEVAQHYLKDGERAKGHSHDVNRLVVGTDSSYVVRGMKEWLPVWKQNGLKTSSGTTPANLDLFLRIDRQIEKMTDGNFSVDFRQVPREQNGIADRLAKSAAEMDRKMDRIMRSSN
ncbi:ribonuclease H-like domain-containing protein [Phyllosticta capitalensis]